MVGAGYRGLHSIVASVCVINAFGNVLYYALVQPRELVVDYRTAYSGITREMLASQDARPFAEVRARVKELLDGRICVGHSVDNDFIVMGIDHPARLTRDTAHDVRRLKQGSRPRRLKHLAAEYLGYKIQRGQHDAAEDARASLYLYLAFREEFEHTARRRAARSAGREARARRDCEAEAVAALAVVESCDTSSVGCDRISRDPVPVVQVLAPCALSRA